MPETERLLTFKEAKLEYIYKVLKAVGGNKRKAAMILNISRSTLHRYMKRGRLVPSAIADTPDEPISPEAA